ncbi:MAG: hypothetical protein KUL88_12610 [Rhizobium sp.]|nr:hypothetical protein [Rhizobium sp.]
MISIDKREFDGGQSRSQSEHWRLEDDDLEGARNWAVILLHVSLMTVPFMVVAWLLS